MPILFLIITAGCKTTKVEYVIILPPKPAREEIKNPTSVAECAEVINYYNSLVKQWEAWGETVEKTLQKISPSLYENAD